MNQYVIIFAFTLVFVASQVYGQDPSYGKPEIKCLQNGGICIQKSECEKFVGKEGEFCPDQYAQGFQCCAGLPISEKRCSMRAGECVRKNFCNKDFVYNDAIDCTADQECCIFV